MNAIPEPEPSARIQRLLGATLVAIEAGLLGYLSETLAYPLMLSLVAFSAAISHQRVEFSREARFRIGAGLAMVFLVKHIVAPMEYRHSVMFIRTQLAAVVAQYVLMLQVGQFFLRRKDDRLPLILPGFGAVVMVCAADVQVRGVERLVTRTLMIAFVMVSALFYGASRTPAEARGERPARFRGVAGAVILLLMAMMTWSAARGLYRHERDIEGLIARVLRGRGTGFSVGFSGNARLDSIARHKLHESDEIALRVYGGPTTLYLRGKAFDVYARSQWQSTAGESLPPWMENHPPALHSSSERLRTFPIVTDTDLSGEAIEIWRSRDDQGVLFTPLHATHVQAPVENVTITWHGTCDSRELAAGQPYRVLAAELPMREPADPEVLQQLTDVGSYAEEHPEVAAIAGEIFADCRTTSEKIQAVERFLRLNFQYRIGIDIPPGQDPLAWFLQHRLPAHCEYFATAAAVLLRMGGVPARYMTGYVVTEQNNFGNYRIARHRDAHAWVEAWDPANGWIIVETTPASGIPTATPASGPRQFRDYLASQLRRFRVMLEQDGLRWLAIRFLSLIVGLPGLIAGVSIAAFVLVRYAPGWWQRARHTQQRPAQRRLHSLLRQMDTRLKKQGLTRQPHETLHQFAARLESHPETAPTECAAWYREYADLRYGGVPEDAALARLHEQTATLRGR